MGHIGGGLNCNLIAGWVVADLVECECWEARCGHISRIETLKSVDLAQIPVVVL